MSDKIELGMLCGVLQSNFSRLSQSESRTQPCHVRINILSSVLCQFEVCAKIRSQAVVLLPCISWPRVVSWPPSSYFEISINLKACIILEWSIIIRFIITTTFKTCATTHLSV